MEEMKPSKMGTEDKLEKFDTLKARKVTMKIYFLESCNRWQQISLYFNTFTLLQGQYKWDKKKSFQFGSLFCFYLNIYFYHCYIIVISLLHYFYKIDVTWKICIESNDRSSRVIRRGFGSSVGNLNCNNDQKEMRETENDIEVLFRERESLLKKLVLKKIMKINILSSNQQFTNLQFK